MVNFKPFRGFLANKKYAQKLIAPPYDVLNSQEARKMAEGNEYSFLHVNKPEIDLKEDINMYSEDVYLKGRENLEKFMKNGWIERDVSKRYYIYS